MTEHLIIPLPNGGHAVVRQDDVANTVSVVTHDGATVVRPANDPHALALLALVAAYDDRPIETIERVCKNARIVDRLQRLPTQRVDRDLVEFIADTSDGAPFCPTAFREYLRTRHAETRDDASWAVYWASIERHVLRLALEMEGSR